LEAQEPDRVAQIAADWGKRRDVTLKRVLNANVYIDRMTKMEDWQVTVLLQIKKAAEGEADDFA
jgi:hypothetical protein